MSRPGAMRISLALWLLCGVCHPAQVDAQEEGSEAESQVAVSRADRGAILQDDDLPPGPTADRPPHEATLPAREGGEPLWVPKPPPPPIAEQPGGDRPSP